MLGPQQDLQLELEDKQTEERERPIEATIRKLDRVYKIHEQSTQKRNTKTNEIATQSRR